MPRGLEWGKPKTFAVLPTDELCNWLISYTQSHETIEMITKAGGMWGPNRDIIGVRFGFGRASDALLFKLTWL